MNEKEQEVLSGHDSREVESSSGDVYKWPKPQRRTKNDTKHRKERSKSQERGVARSYRESGFSSAKRVAGSGNIAGLPGDVDPGSWFLGECKETRSGKLVVDPEWVEKIEAQSRQRGRPWWALHLWIADTTSNYRKVVVLDEGHFFQLIRRLKAYEEAEE